MKVQLFDNLAKNEAKKLIFYGFFMLDKFLHLN